MPRPSSSCSKSTAGAVRCAYNRRMATIRIPDEKRTFAGLQTVTAFLAGAGIEHEVWKPERDVSETAPAEEILSSYKGEIDRLKARGCYVTADVIDVGPSTPNLEAMLAKFRSEHWHDEDEVRFIIGGPGIFFIRPSSGPVFAIEVEPGDLIRVPKGTKHWFDLCADRRIRAIRLFQDPSGWTPQYTQSGIDQGYQPVCMGPAFIPPPPAPPAGA